MKPNLKQRQISGSSLQEVLMAIAVFAVGITAVMQVFPSGLKMLRSSKDNAHANELAQVQISRLKIYSKELPSEIVSGELSSFEHGDKIEVRTKSGGDHFWPFPFDAKNGVSFDGNLFLNGHQKTIPWWMQCGINQQNIILGESKMIPAPLVIQNKSGPIYGSIVHLNFGPTGGVWPVGSFLNLYGNPLMPITGQPDLNGLIQPASGVFYIGQTDIWIPKNGTAKYSVGLRVNNSTVEPNRYLFLISAATPGIEEKNGYLQCSITDLLKGFKIEKFQAKDVDLASITVASVFEMVDRFDENKSYQYKVLNDGLGWILLHPDACQQTLETPYGSESLRLYADYRTYDWQILRDDFVIPKSDPPVHRLLVDGIMKLGSKGPDGKLYKGLGLNGLAADKDFILVDKETGGIYQESSYNLDYSKGILVFKGSSAEFLLGSKENKVLTKDIRGRPVRALYKRRGSWGIQVQQAARLYKVLPSNPMRSLTPGECYIGFSKIYFPKEDAGKLVKVGQIFIKNVARREILRDRVFLIKPSRDGGGPAFIDLSELGAHIDSSPEYYPSVHRVCGISISVQVERNPNSFRLQQDIQKNRQSLLDWADQTRKTILQTTMTKGK